MRAHTKHCKIYTTLIDNSFSTNSVISVSGISILQMLLIDVIGAGRAGSLQSEHCLVSTITRAILFSPNVSRSRLHARFVSKYFYLYRTPFSIFICKPTRACIFSFTRNMPRYFKSLQCSFTICDYPF